MAERRGEAANAKSGEKEESMHQKLETRENEVPGPKKVNRAPFCALMRFSRCTRKALINGPRFLRPYQGVLREAVMLFGMAEERFPGEGDGRGRRRRPVAARARVATLAPEGHEVAGPDTSRSTKHFLLKIKSSKYHSWEKSVAETGNGIGHTIRLL